jgi:uncharacterized RDD family membrane protein YckC
MSRRRRDETPMNDESGLGAPLAAVPVRARPYQGRRAGVVTRFVASAVDLVVVVVIVGVIYAVIAGFGFLLHPRSFQWPENLGWSIPVIGFVILVPYLTFSWCTSGRTYGDVLLGLRVVDWRGERMRVPWAVLRAIACTVFPIGLLWAAISPGNRSVQDVLLRTSVIYDWTPRTADG